ncbi:MAG: hypothetical protein LBI13_08945 [Streptococcaceae bacterium]|jgi:hypothetical protein|nr:hypothetical protein [Streptococcaceae bacterium]
MAKNKNKNYPENIENQGTSEPSEVLENSSVDAENDSTFDDLGPEKETKISEDIYHEAVLDFSKLSSGATIGDLQEEAQLIEEENLAAESPLDRYIRKHREEVENVKSGFGKEIDKTDAQERKASSEESSEENFEEEVLIDSSTAPSENITESENLADSVVEGENLISSDSQRSDNSEMDRLQTVEELESEKTSLAEADFVQAEMIDTSIFPAPTLKELDEEVQKADKELDKIEFSSNSLSESAAPEVFLSFFNKRSERNVSVPEGDNDEADSLEIIDSVDSEEKEESGIVADESTRTLQSNRRKVIIGLLAGAVIVVAGVVIVGSLINNNNSSKSSAKVSSSSSSLVESKALANFSKDYVAFFTDSKKTALKNSNFDMLSSLKTDLVAISTADSKYSTFKSEYDNLSDDITAVKSINSIFDKPAIVDGKLDSTVILNTGVTIPTVSSKNSSINSVLIEAINLAKSQQAQSEAASSAAAASASAASSSSSSANSAATSVGTNNTSSTSGSTTSGSGNYSQNPNGVAVNNAGSRVPIQNVDGNSAAFAWPAGYLQIVISEMQSRGYISGDNYILLPVAIDTAGEGWYNIYRPDGSYLFSINCKTAFWAGNGSAHPDLGATF